MLHNVLRVDIVLTIFSFLDIRMTNVPNIRVNYRYETLQSELEFIES